MSALPGMGWISPGDEEFAQWSEDEIDPQLPPPSQDATPQLAGGDSNSPVLGESDARSYPDTGYPPFETEGSATRGSEQIAVDQSTTDRGAAVGYDAPRADRSEADDSAQVSPYGGSVGQTQRGFYDEHYDGAAPDNSVPREYPPASYPAGPADGYASDDPSGYSSYGQPVDSVSPPIADPVVVTDPQEPTTGYGNAPTYDGGPGYETAGSYADGLGDGNAPAYERGPGYETAGNHENEPGYGSVPAYESGPGYEVAGGHDRDRAAQDRPTPIAEQTPGDLPGGADDGFHDHLRGGYGSVPHEHDGIREQVENQTQPVGEPAVGADRGLAGQQGPYGMRPADAAPAMANQVRPEYAEPADASPRGVTSFPADSDPYGRPSAARRVVRPWLPGSTRAYGAPDQSSYVPSRVAREPVQPAGYPSPASDVSNGQQQWQQGSGNRNGVVPQYR